MGSFVFAFAGCALAGLGLQRVLDADADERALLRGRLAYVGGVLAALAPCWWRFFRRGRPTRGFLRCTKTLRRRSGLCWLGATIGSRAGVG